MSDLILITSVIDTGTKAWSYINARSVYTPEQRFQQTLETIVSIRKYFPNARILLSEVSNISEEYTKTLKSKVDYYVNLYENPEIRISCLESNIKALGEATHTKYTLEFIINKEIPFTRLFKISGRYTLTEQFKVENFSREIFTFKKRLPTQDGKIIISTILYSVPKVLIFHLYNALQQVIEVSKQNKIVGYEEILPKLCEPRQEIETIGACGLIAVTQNELVSV